MWNRLLKAGRTKRPAFMPDGYKAAHYDHYEVKQEIVSKEEMESKFAIRTEFGDGVCYVCKKTTAISISTLYRPQTPYMQAIHVIALAMGMRTEICPKCYENAHIPRMAK